MRPSTNRFYSRLLMLVGFLAMGTACFGQQFQPLTQGTVVTGECQGRESQPACVLPSVFGAQGLSLFPNPGFPHYAHFIGSAQTILNQGLGTAIATELANLPLISPASGFTYKYESASGAFVRSTASFGPIYTERAETIGRKKVSVGVSYQRFRFSSIDGVDLQKIPAVFTHVPNTGPGQIPEPYEADVISTTNNIKLNLDQTMLFGTVGITDHVDVSVAVPISSVRVAATSNANIIRVSGPTFTLAGTNIVLPNPHAFDAAGTQSKVFSNSGSASGIGDVIIRAKANVYQSETGRLAVALDVRTPSGDPRQLLGSGAVGIRPFVIISTGKKFSPHANIGYQWNGQSILAGNITGATIVEDPTTETVVIANGPSTKQSLPSQVFYWLGADYGISENRLTLVFDYLGQTVINAPRISPTTMVTQNIPGGTGALPLPTITGLKNNVALNNGAIGAKYNIYHNLLLTGDILFRMDNNGLRQNVTPLVALSYTFGQ